MQACAEERKVFCEEVNTGQARVFRCLVQNLGQPDFGASCTAEVTRKLQRRQDNWKLDVNLRSACKADSDAVCSDVDHDSDHADMTRCLILKIGQLSGGCAREVRCLALPAFARSLARDMVDRCVCSLLSMPFKIFGWLRTPSALPPLHTAHSL